MNLRRAQKIFIFAHLISLMLHGKYVSFAKETISSSNIILVALGSHI